MITRYYEFLFPLLVIASGLLQNYVQPKTKVRAVSSGLLIAALVFFWIYVSGVTLSFADSGLLSGYLSGPGVVAIISTFGILVAVFWVINLQRISKIIAYGVTPVVLLLAGITSSSQLLSEIGTNNAYFDVAGQKAKSMLADVPGERISIVGPVRYQNFTTKFWIDKPGIQDFSLPEGQAVSPDALPKVSHVVLIGNAILNGENKVLEQGEGYAIIEIVR